MRRKTMLLLLFCIFSSPLLLAQEKMYIHQSNKMTLGIKISAVDSIWFSNDGLTAFFQLTDTLVNYPITAIDSITFGDNSNTVTLSYNGSDVTVVNPLAFEGVAVTVTGSDVVVNATTPVQDINFQLQGSTPDGMFKIYTLKRYNLVMNGISITNPDGPAINVQSEKKTTVILNDGTTNTFTDGPVYAEPPSGEDQDGAFFSEAKLVISGNGSLIINGFGEDQHGLCTDDEMDIQGGVITVNSAVKDGIHANDGIKISGGTIHVTSEGDGIDGDEGYLTITGGSITTINDSEDVKGMASDSTLLISGGTVDVTVNGDQSKGLKSDREIVLSGGTITIHNTGDAVLETSGSGYDPSYCTAIKSDGNVTISGAEITIVTTGKGGKSISSDADLIMTSGSVQITNSGNGATYVNSSGVMDAYVATCFSTDGDIDITGGSVITSSSGSAGKGFSSDAQLNVGNETSSPTIQITTTGARIYISGSGQNANYAEAKAIKCDSAVLIQNGTLTISSADDGIKSETSITINNATVTINNSVEGLEAPFITINSGNVHVSASDDAINTTFGSGGEFDDGSLMSINGGYLVVSATQGDGLDSNGDIVINGGTTIVHGPSNAPEVGMDYNGSCNVNAGLLVISGSNSNMTQAPGNTSQQRSLKIMTNQSLSATTLFHIQDASANDVLTFQPVRKYYSIIFSSSALVAGASYSIYTGGTCTGGTLTDGLYTGGTYSGGTLRKSFTVSGTVTNVNF
ncbi:MAG TPA: carbohydrate-binding domain-containing protein [Bacteroidales bacterium]|nr:carbohydrate-binding domain-containing protein [Bacteroidales bacterium]